MKASEYAGNAAKLLDGDRDRTHGNKRDNHDNIASLWSAYLTRKLKRPVVLTSADVALLMVLLKVARTLAGALNVDDMVDAVGYSAIAGELLEQLDTESKAQDLAKPDHGEMAEAIEAWRRKQGGISIPSAWQPFHVDENGKHP